MKKWAKNLIQVGAAMCLLLGLCWIAAQGWLGSADFKRRVEGEASMAVGVPVRLDRIALDVWPVPAVALLAVRVETQPVATIERVEARADLRALLAGRMELSSLRVVRADVSQAGLNHLLTQRGKNAATKAGGVASTGLATLPGHVLLENLTWRPLTGAPTTLDGEARFGPEHLPDTVSLMVLAGQFQGAKLHLARRQLAWDVLVDYAGGRIKGDLHLDHLPAPGVVVAVRGALTTEGVELGVLSRQRLTGRLNADTTLALRSGQVALAPSLALSGRVQVSLGPAVIGQAVGVPLVLGGILDAPELTLTRSAMLGAALGTMVMPGVGTGAGASLGDKIGNKLQELFGK
jgi:hypothetical protein